MIKLVEEEPYWKQMASQGRGIEYPSFADLNGYNVLIHYLHQTFSDFQSTEEEEFDFLSIETHSSDSHWRTENRT